MAAFEEEYGILPLADAIARFNDTFPNSDVTKLQLEYEGPFLKYEFVGNDGVNRNTFEINAQTGDALKERQKPLKEKMKDPQRREAKALNLENLLPLAEINDLALEQSPVKNPFQWELDRAKERTVWKVELAEDTGGQVTELKIDAQDGTLVQMKLKS